MGLNMRSFTINVPASTANLACGYDVLGLALDLWLKLDVAIPDEISSSRSKCKITCSGSGSERISCDPEQNMITSTALNVLRCHGISQLPPQTTIHIHNDIALGRGLGSSGAAIVAGVMLANTVGELKLTKERMMEYCLAEENHPDNIGASLFGGFIGSFLEEINPTQQGQNGQLPNGDIERAKRYPTLRAISCHYTFSNQIKIIAVIPDYEVKTESARAVLPPSYEKKDVVFNLQRVALLPHFLGSAELNPEAIYSAMQDRVHQQYRVGLVHGLDSLLKLDPSNTPGLLGICLSGAGPTVLAFVTDNHEAIAQKMIDTIRASSEKSFTCEWKLLDVARHGATVTRHDDKDGFLPKIGAFFNALQQNVRLRP